jgi:hypothetical protein
MTFSKFLTGNNVYYSKLQKNHITLNDNKILNFFGRDAEKTFIGAIKPD